MKKRRENIRCLALSLSVDRGQGPAERESIVKVIKSWLAYPEGEDPGEITEVPEDESGPILEVGVEELQEVQESTGQDDVAGSEEEEDPDKEEGRGECVQGL